MRNFLSHTQYRLLSYDNSEALLDGIDRQRPDLLIVDEDLFPTSGVQIVLQLSARFAPDRLPYLFVSRTHIGAWPMWATVDEIYGAISFISLPFGGEEFRSLVDRLIKGIAEGKFPTKFTRNAWQKRMQEHNAANGSLHTIKQ